METLGIAFVDSIMTLIAFIPVLAALSVHVESVPFLGSMPYALVFLALAWSAFGTALLILAGVNLPGLEFKNQRVEAAYRKELVFGEDNAERAAPPTLRELFQNVRRNYFRIYILHIFQPVSLHVPSGRQCDRLCVSCADHCQWQNYIGHYEPDYSCLWASRLILPVPGIFMDDHHRADIHLQTLQGFERAIGGLPYRVLMKNLLKRVKGSLGSDGKIVPATHKLTKHCLRFARDSDSETAELHAALDRFDARLACVFDEFCGYCEEAEKRGIENYPLYHWTKSVIDDPKKQQKHQLSFTIYMGAAAIYPVASAKDLMAALEAVANGKASMCRWWIQTQQNPQPPASSQIRVAGKAARVACFSCSSDDNPTRNRPWISYIILGLCLCVFYWQISLGAAQQAAIFGYGMVPARLFGALTTQAFPIRLAAGPHCLPPCSCMAG